MPRRASTGAVLLLVLLSLAVLTVVGIALAFSTESERASAASEWAIERALYAADAGIRWTGAQLSADPGGFLGRPEFADPPDPFGSVLFPLPGHFHGPGGLFSGDPSEDSIRVTVENPGFLGRRVDPAALDGDRFFYAFEVRVAASEAANAARFRREIVADLEVGPLPADFLEKGERGTIIFGHTVGVPVRVVSMNWKER